MLLGCGSIYAAIDVDVTSNLKGGACDGYAVSVSSLTAATIMAASGLNTDWMMKNYGPYDVFIDSHAQVNISGTDQGYRFEVGEAIPMQGITRFSLYGKATAGSSNSTIYIFKISK